MQILSDDGATMFEVYNTDDDKYRVTYMGDHKLPVLEQEFDTLAEAAQAFNRDWQRRFN